jgi:hypothetical protein
MKRLPALGLLAFVGCATAPVPQTLRLSGNGKAPQELPGEAAEPVRLETRAGTFLVNPGHVEDFAKLLAGESVPTPFYAGVDR